jgi:putative ABC transport system permease protein
MTFMVVMLSGLTAGLGAASISAVDLLPVDHFALQRPAAGQSASFSTSTLDTDTARRLAAQRGVAEADPIGVATSQLQAGATTAAVTLMGTDPRLYPARETGRDVAAGQIAVTRKLADDAHLRPGDTVEVAGQPVTVAAVVRDASFNHLPVAYTGIDTWQRITHSEGITAVGLRLDGATAATLGDAAGVRVLDKAAAFGAVGAYSSEQGSLNLMRGLLVAVSVLVVGSFFTVWTMQRSGDLAVVRALGGSRGYLLRDALGQALVLLVAGAVGGAAAAAGVGVVAAAFVPFVVSGATVAVPLIAMVGVGLLGAALAVRKVSTVDPLSALGAAR